MSQTRIPESPPASTHNPDKPPHPDAGPAADTDRGPDGRFLKGNKGGPGNPFARQVAALRQAFLAVVTAQDIANIAKAMIEKANQGDVAAARLVYQYSLGKPAEVVDPDRLDELEFQQWTRENVTDANPEVLTGLNARAANIIARGLVPAMQQGYFESMQQMIEEREEQRREEREEDEEAERIWAQEEAARQAREAEQRPVPPRAAPTPSKEPVPPVSSPTRPSVPARTQPRENVSPAGAHQADHDGQRETRTARQRDVERVLQMLEATVNKRDETARHAANDFVD